MHCAAQSTCTCHACTAHALLFTFRGPACLQALALRICYSHNDSCWGCWHAAAGMLQLAAALSAQARDTCCSALLQCAWLGTAATTAPPAAAASTHKALAWLAARVTPACRATTPPATPASHATVSGTQHIGALSWHTDNAGGGYGAPARSALALTAWSTCACRCTAWLD